MRRIMIEYDTDSKEYTIKEEGCPSIVCDMLSEVKEELDLVFDEEVQMEDTGWGDEEPIKHPDDKPGWSQ